MKLVKPKAQVEGVLALSLPGPTRKRDLAEYRFRVTYRGTQIREPGCLMTWEVTGGRTAYQLALERTDSGTTRWHCTCADYAFRGEDTPCYHCKHVAGLLEMLEVVRVPAA